MNSKRIDIGMGSALCVLSAGIFIYADRYKGTGVNRYGPNFFPQVLCVFLFAAAALLIVKALKGGASERRETIDRTGFIRAAAVLGMTLLYLLLMQAAGFFLSTLLFLYVLMAFIGQKGPWARIVSSAGASLVIYGIFHFFLKIPLPQGIFRSIL